MHPNDAPSANRQLSSASIGTVASVLNTIEVDPETVQKIIEVLKESQDGIDGASFEVVDPPAFGGSSAGQTLGYHQVLAHNVVRDAMTDMLNDLGRAQENVKKYVESQEYNDFETTYRIKQVIESLPLVGPIFGKAF